MSKGQSRSVAARMFPAAISLLFVFAHAGSQASAKQAGPVKLQAVELRVSAPKGEAKLTGTVDELLRVAFPKGTIGVHVAEAKAAAEYNVTILRAPAGADPKTLTRKDFTQVEVFSMKLGDSATRQLSDAVEVGIAIPRGAALEGQSGSGDCTCCVTCSNGVVICGCRFQSSCGNCPHN